MKSLRFPSLMMRLVPSWHRAYVRSHPLGLAVALGVFLSGILGTFLPEVTEQSAPALVLPSWVLLLFNVTWMVGGGLTTVGMLRGILRFEVPGLALLGGGLSAYYVVVISVRAWSALAAIFIGLLALGCFARAWHLSRSGYDERAGEWSGL